MKIVAKDFDDYLSKAGEYEADLRELDALIKRVAPHIKPKLVSGGSYTMLGYGMQPYQSTAMKQPGEWPVVALAAQKHHMSLYLCALEDGEYIAEKYQDELGKVSCGKSCIRFKRLDDLNKSTLHKLLTSIDRRVVAGELVFSQ